MLEHTANQSHPAFPVWSHQGSSLCATSGTILTTGRVYVPIEVLRVTIRAFLSEPGWICSIRARGHLVGCDTSPLKHTMSPTLRFRDKWLQLANCWRLVKYSCEQCCRRWHVTTWQRCQLCNDMGLDGSARSGNACKGCTIRKWPSVRTSIPSSGWGKGVNGL